MKPVRTAERPIANFAIFFRVFVGHDSFGRQNPLARGSLKGNGHVSAFVASQGGGKGLGSKSSGEIETTAVLKGLGTS